MAETRTRSWLVETGSLRRKVMATDPKAACRLAILKYRPRTIAALAKITDRAAHIAFYVSTVDAIRERGRGKDGQA